MTNVWFTADWHVGSKNIIKYCNRPFDSVEEMDEALIENYNSVVQRGDRVYMLGDMIWGHQNYKHVLSRLKGEKYLILGNHDNRQVYKKCLIDGLLKAIYDVKGVSIDGNYYWLSHYCHRVWNMSCHGSYHLFGHSHGNCSTENRSMDVGVDNCNYFPIDYTTCTKLLNYKKYEFHY